MLLLLLVVRTATPSDRVEDVHAEQADLRTHMGTPPMSACVSNIALALSTRPACPPKDNGAAGQRWCGEFAEEASSTSLEEKMLAVHERCARSTPRARAVLMKQHGVRNRDARGRLCRPATPPSLKWRRPTRYAVITWNEPVTMGGSHVVTLALPANARYPA